MYRTHIRIVDSDSYDFGRLLFFVSPVVLQLNRRDCNMTLGGFMAQF